MLSFIHLSDIHFRRYSGDLYDIDNDLRAELIHDISHRLLKNLRPNTVVVLPLIK